MPVPFWSGWHVTCEATRMTGGYMFRDPLRRDPLVVGWLAFMAVAAVVACWIPARRAARVNPMITLRSE